MTLTLPIALSSRSAASRFARAGTTWLTLPFDALRAQYALAVRAGYTERSLLASGRVERALALVERLALGPWARRV